MEGKREEKMEWSKPVLMKLSQEQVAQGACMVGSAPSGSCKVGFGV